ncbi:hypothetical protein CRG98_050231 [Punica granatum]|uniref:Uncharacterized protein n=1 Tax=Punica granatum TaxID=22663 RepID=A0A2I0GK35_PUNGR|nr:hypothetical protein CRG98_050231 [Punica granatum]
MPFPPSTGMSTGDLEAVSNDYPEFEIATPEPPEPPIPSPSLYFVSFFLKKFLTGSDCLCRVEADTRRIRITLDHLWSPLESPKHCCPPGPAARTSELPFQAFPFQSDLSRPFGYPTSHNLLFCRNQVALGPDPIQFGPIQPGSQPSSVQQSVRPSSPLGPVRIS